MYNVNVAYIVRSSKVDMWINFEVDIWLLLNSL